MCMRMITIEKASCKVNYCKHNSNETQQFLHHWWVHQLTYMLMQDINEQLSTVILTSIWMNEKTMNSNQWNYTSETYYNRRYERYKTVYYLVQHSFKPFFIAKCNWQCNVKGSSDSFLHHLFISKNYQQCDWSVACTTN